MHFVVDNILIYIYIYMHLWSEGHHHKRSFSAGTQSPIRANMSQICQNTSDAKGLISFPHHLAGITRQDSHRPNSLWMKSKTEERWCSIWKPASLKDQIPFCMILRRKWLPIFWVKQSEIILDPSIHLN